MDERQLPGFSPPTECDLVLKGGTTSGVIYPTLVARLASTFRIRSVGGTSAGAIAAVVAAAAQFGRNAGHKEGFDVLEKMPVWLAQKADGHTNLYHLFQPAPGLERHLRFAEDLMKARRLLTFFARLVLGGLTHFWRGALLLGAPGILIAYLAWTSRAGSLYLVAGILLALVGLGVGALLDFVATLVFKLPGNDYGLCKGMPVGATSRRALTEWLHEQIQAAAGITNSATPLTFGMLKAQSESIRVTLLTMTSCISLGRAQKLPFDDTDKYYFRESEMRALLPKEVVDWMVGHPNSKAPLPTVLAASPEAPEDLRPLPAEEHFPVLLAARMSLSFPVLLSTVPLWKIRVRRNEQEAQRTTARRLLYTDGGATSNFPLHFFDSLLPIRPTFGIFLRDDLPEDAREEERVYLPSTNLGGINVGYFDIPERGWRGTIGFFVGLVQTMKDWRDNALRVTPGYRDRVVQIRHTKAEGGLNLDMDPDAIGRLSRSGALAANRLIEAFHDNPARTNRWLNHRWVRARSSLCLLDSILKGVAAGLNQPDLDPPLADLVRKGIGPGGDLRAYRFRRIAQVNAALAVLQHLDRAAQASAGDRMCDGAPRPTPSLSVSPRL